MFKNKENKRAIRYIMDTFTGADGGVAFLNFLVSMERIEMENSKSGTRILNIMKDFASLIAILQHPPTKEDK